MTTDHWLNDHAITDMDGIARIHGLPTYTELVQALRMAVEEAVADDLDKWWAEATTILARIPT